MKFKIIVALGVSLAVAVATYSFASVRGGDDRSCASDCLAPEICGDTEAVCPAGPDCWMPDLCADRTVVCPPSD